MAKQQCSRVDSKGHQCRHPSQVVGGWPLDFCKLHQNMVVAGSPQFCQRCGEVKSLDIRDSVSAWKSPI
jgi:hypothetical protein